MTLLERDFELNVLHRRHAEALQGTGRTVLITGEAGIGKTSLIREFGATFPGSSQILIGACDPLSTPSAHGPLHDIAPALGGSLLEHMDAEATSAPLFASVLEQLRRRPGTVVAIEDVHWADEATLDLLRYLGRRIDQVPILLLITARPDDATATPGLRRFLGDAARFPALDRIVLQPLSQEAVSQLAAPHSISPESVFWRTGGNPFFVSELLSSEGALPQTVHDVVVDRWSRLSADAQEVSQIAAVLGPGSDATLIEALFERSATSAIEEAVRAGLLAVTAAHIGFRHELAREAVLASIPPLKKRELHRAILRIASEQMPNADPAWLAHHARGGGDPEEIRAFSLLAAERATALGANREAIEHYQHALTSASGQPLDIRIPLLERFAAAATLSGWSREDLVARAELLEIYRSRGDRRMQAEHLRFIAADHVLQGENEAADAALREAVLLLEGLEPSVLHAQVIANQALLLMLNRKNTAAIGVGRRAIDIAERFGDLGSIVRSQNAIGSALIVSDNLAEGKPILEAAIATARAEGMNNYAVSLRGNLGSASGEIFELETAEQALLQTISEAQAADLDGPESYVTAWLALVRLYLGRWDECAHAATAAIDMPHAWGISTMMAWVALGRLRARRGDPEVWEALDQALLLAEPTGTLQRLAPVAAARAEARWLAGDSAGTALEARRAYDLARVHGHRWHCGELTYWLKRAGETVPIPEDVARPWELHLQGQFEAAADEWQRRGCPYEAARARMESPSAKQVQLALRAFETLGARPIAQRAAQRLRELGQSSIPRGPRRSTRENPAGLTARELDVLDQLATGATYAEIGTALYVSTRTVEHHVSSVLRKLEASSRRDAVRIAVERGIISG